MKKLRRAAIRYQNSVAAKGNYIPSMAEAMAFAKRNTNDKDSRSSESNGSIRYLL